MSMSKDISEILDMLSYKRPAGSEAENEFRRRFLLPLGVEPDRHNNLIARVGEGNPRVLWSSHTDTVHGHSGSQRVVLENGTVSLHKKAKSSCLGADNAAGVWIMMEMMRAGVPGLYIFHHAEERGGIGSRAIATDNPDLVLGCRAAIAFDRRGTTSIITHQGGSRTASDAFATSLADQLQPGFRIDPTGTFTDTRSYEALIPECTNVSAGFRNEHTSIETLDIEHLIRLRDHMVALDVETLVIERDPATAPRRETGRLKLLSSRPRQDDTLYDLIYLYPRETASVLERLGVTGSGFRRALEEEWSSQRPLRQERLPFSL